MDEDETIEENSNEIIDEDIYEFLAEKIKEVNLIAYIFDMLGLCFFCKRTLMYTETNNHLCICRRTDCNYGEGLDLFEVCCDTCFKKLAY